MRYVWLALWMICLSYSLPVWAQSSFDMIFVYPGGQGSPEQAQPLLDQFSEQLKQASKGKLQAKLKYYTDYQAAEAKIRSGAAAAGILAQDLFSEQGKAWQARPILRTQMLPSADGTNRFFLMGPKGASLPASGELTLTSSRPIPSSYILDQLFPDWSMQVKVQPSPNVVGILRKVGSGKSNEWVLLDQFEHATITRLKSAWVSGLEVTAQSKPVPSAPVVVFGEGLDPKTRAQLEAALLQMGKSSGAQEVLQLLRLKGFQKM